MRRQWLTPGGTYIAVTGTRDQLSIIVVSLQIGETITEQRSSCTTTQVVNQSPGVWMTGGENAA